MTGMTNKKQHFRGDQQNYTTGPRKDQQNNTTEATNKTLER